MKTQNYLRILQLLPKDLVCPLAINPAIPEDFIALNPEDMPNCSNWTYWGPEEALKTYFKDPASLKEPVLRVTLSPSIAQTKPNILDSTEIKQFIEEMKSQNQKDFTYLETLWGDYPVFTVQVKFENRTMVMAWVGQNCLDSRSVLMFNLVYPENQNHPSEKDLLLWNNFINKTELLTDGEYFKAHGQDLQPGYTIVTEPGGKLTIHAEKREKDGEIQIVVIPESQNVKFHYARMEEVRMGAQWKYGEPLLKVYGTIETYGVYGFVVNDQVTSIFLKNVSDFSLGDDEMKKSNNLVFRRSSQKSG